MGACYAAPGATTDVCKLSADNDDVLASCPVAGPARSAKGAPPSEVGAPPSEVPPDSEASSCSTGACDQGRQQPQSTTAVLASVPKRPILPGCWRSSPNRSSCVPTQGQEHFPSKHSREVIAAVGYFCEAPRKSPESEWNSAALLDELNLEAAREFFEVLPAARRYDKRPLTPSFSLASM